MSPRTLRGSIMVSGFSLTAVVLLAAFTAVDLLLSRQIARDLAATAAAQLGYLQSAVSHHSTKGLVALVEELSELERHTHAIAEVRRAGGVVFSSPLFPGARGDAEAMMSAKDGTRYYVARSLAGTFAIAVAVPVAPLEQVRRELQPMLMACCAAALLASAVASRWLAGRIVSPLDRLAAAVERVDVASLSYRIPLDRRSVLEIGRVGDSFNRMLARLEETVAALRRFIGDASHELRTPLAILKTRVQEDPSASRAPLVDDIDRLQALLDDLLLLARLDAAAPDREPFDLSDVVIETSEQMRPLSAAKGIALVVSVSGPLRTAGDPRQIRRLIVNLLDNALKYTPHGGLVSVEASEREGHARIAVSDTGVGIPAEHLTRVMEPFYRADASRSRHSGGAGLGLAICARVAENHGGSLTADSTPSRGTRMAVTLPLGSYRPPTCAR